MRCLRTTWISACSWLIGPGQKLINVRGRMAGVAAIRSSCNCTVRANYCFILSDVAARLPRNGFVTSGRSFTQAPSAQTASARAQCPFKREHHDSRIIRRRTAPASRSKRHGAVPLIMTRPGRAPGGALTPPVPALERAGHTKPVVVVPVPGGVPVAVRGAQVPRIVVKGTATQHAPGGGSGSRAGSNHPPRKMDWRKRQVSACSA